MLSLVIYSILTTQIMHLFFPEPWSKSVNPLVDVIWPMWAQGILSPNALTIRFPELGIWSLLPALILIITLLADLLRLCIPQRKLLHLALISVTVIAMLGFIGTQERAKIGRMKKWVKLVKIWDQREERYHKE